LVNVGEFDAVAGGILDIGREASHGLSIADIGRRIHRLQPA
jgi:hypothetical protein